MARNSFPPPVVPAHIEALVPALPLIDRVSVSTQLATFNSCAGTPNTLFTPELRTAVSTHLRKLGFRGAGYHIQNGFNIRNSGQELTASHAAYVQEQLGPRYKARIEKGHRLSTLLISVAEWYTPTDIKQAFRLNDYRTSHTHVVKADMATQVTGLRFEPGQGVEDARNGYFMLEMENLLARPYVDVACSVEFVRSKGSDDIYDMVIRGTWTGDSDMTPAFMRRG